MSNESRGRVWIWCGLRRRAVSCLSDRQHPVLSNTNTAQSALDSGQQPVQWQKALITSAPHLSSQSHSVWNVNQFNPQNMMYSHIPLFCCFFFCLFVSNFNNRKQRPLLPSICVSVSLAAVLVLSLSETNTSQLSCSWRGALSGGKSVWSQHLSASFLFSYVVLGSNRFDLWSGSSQVH